MLLGFSQGACLGLEYAARHARRYGGLVGSERRLRDLRSPLPSSAFVHGHYYKYMIEIERKFLVATDEWKRSVVRSVSIRDGLIAVYKDR